MFLIIQKKGNRWLASHVAAVGWMGAFDDDGWAQTDDPLVRGRVIHEMKDGELTYLVVRYADREDRCASGEPPKSSGLVGVVGVGRTATIHRTLGHVVDTSWMSGGSFKVYVRCFVHEAFSSADDSHWLHGTVC